MNRTWQCAVATVSVLLATGCGAGGATTATPPGPIADQIALGKAVYSSKCAGCHGLDGTGGDDTALIGDRALPVEGSDVAGGPRQAGKPRTTKFLTASDVYVYTKTNMPDDGSPGSLKDSEYLALTAWMLNGNHVTMSAPLDSVNAASIRLH